MIFLCFKTNCKQFEIPFFHGFIYLSVHSQQKKRFVEEKLLGVSLITLRSPLTPKLTINMKRKRAF